MCSSWCFCWRWCIGYFDFDFWFVPNLDGANITIAMLPFGTLANFSGVNLTDNCKEVLFLHFCGLKFVSNAIILSVAPFLAFFNTTVLSKGMNV